MLEDTQKTCNDGKECYDYASIVAKYNRSRRTDAGPQEKGAIGGRRNPSDQFLMGDNGNSNEIERE